MSETASHRLLISLKPSDIDRLRAEAKKFGLHLATHISSIVVQHLGRKRARK